MESFEELGVAPELVEALSAEGIERPTALQEQAIPILRRGNNLVLAAGPGSGLFVAWVAPLLELVEPEGDSPRALVLTATPETAARLGVSLARLAATSGHTVGALGSPWRDPAGAQVVLGTAEDVLEARSSGAMSLSRVQALVVDQAQLIDRLSGLDPVERVIDHLPAEAQRVVTALPVTDPVSDLVERHVRRAVTLPVADPSSSPRRGRVRFRITPEPREEAALTLAGELLASGDAEHVLFFCNSEDRAADLGDYLTLHGFAAGAPGDRSVPVWLGVEALPARATAQGVDGVLVVSCDVPSDTDALDRRHGFGAEGYVLVLARELAHLKGIGRAAGYEAVPSPPPTRAPSAMDRLREELERTIAQEGSAPYVAVLEPLFERHDPAEVAAAAVALLHEGRRPPEHPASRARERAEPAAEPAWAKLFIGVGERDDLRPGDLLGAITGEAGVDGKAVGKIDIRESHSLVEVHDSVARVVIRALNGTTIRGRAVRADFDRPRKGSPRRVRPT